MSTASLLVRVASGSADRSTILTAGVAGLVAGAISMAAGEYVSVSSQADTKRAKLDKERQALAESPEVELAELAQICVERGMDGALAWEVAGKLMLHEDLAIHARDELGSSEAVATRPIQAALTSSATFSVGAALPFTAVAVAPVSGAIPAVAVTSLESLGLLGAVSARAGGADVANAAMRVVVWGALAMAFTAGTGGRVRDGGVSARWTPQRLEGTRGESELAVSWRR